MIRALAFGNTEGKVHKERVGLCHIHIYKTLTNRLVWTVTIMVRDNVDAHTPEI